MQSFNFGQNELILLYIFSIFIGGIFLFVIFYFTHYKRFRPNEYVIWLRNGKVRRKSGTGGAGLMLPIIDEVIVIPTTVQQILLEAKDLVISHEYQNLSLIVVIYWRVSDPEVSFGKVSWIHSKSDYIVNVLRNAAESIIRTTCANKQIEVIIRDRQVIIKDVVSNLHILVADWGIKVESVEIRDIQILDLELKKNFEAIKKLDEQKNALVREAQMNEVTKLRNLQVDLKTGLQDQDVKLAVDTKTKEREIHIQELEQNRAIIEAETTKKQIVIAAEAQKSRQISTSVDVDVQRISREAEARKMQLLAQAEGESAIILEKMIAQADGLLKQVNSAKKADQRFIQLKTVETLPKIFSNIKIDNMILLGEGQDAFKSVSQLVLPFMQVAQNIVTTNKNSIKMSEKTENKSQIIKKPE